ncbi:hypothetical protein AVEN_230447-1 [Araneus ventricosus]|uniref:Uncharacterized protein n=1 Tax=Araneus ventricosus TaxID=182803 RepID=A0A4Y2KQ09_ARAVE|nr:hypothetical protein AVEN_230447-1 [Araneus ventricosus]
MASSRTSLLWSLGTSALKRAALILASAATVVFQSSYGLGCVLTILIALSVSSSEELWRKVSMSGGHCSIIVHIRVQITKKKNVQERGKGSHPLSPHLTSHVPCRVKHKRGKRRKKHFSKKRIRKKLTKKKAVNQDGYHLLLSEASIAKKSV